MSLIEMHIYRVGSCAGERRHLLDLGHGFLVKTPEAAVAHFFDVVRGLRYMIPFCLKMV